jgi:hypothetical protein
MSRYSDDVLAPGWQQARRRPSVDTPVSVGLVVEEPTSGFVGAIVRWENGLVVLEDRAGARRSFPLGPGFWIDGSPVSLVHPPRVRPAAPTHTASGSRVAPQAPAKIALASRIYVEGRHDAELVERIWGDDLRAEGVVVEYLGGIDDLPAIVADFAPTADRRLGVLVDHLVAGTKETRIVAQVSGASPATRSSTSGRRSVQSGPGWPSGRGSRRGRTSRLASAARWDVRRAPRPTSRRPGRGCWDACATGVTSTRRCRARWSA